MENSKSKSLTAIIASATILLILMPLTTYAVPDNHYFKSIDYSDNEYINLGGEIPRIEVAVDESNNRAFTVFSLGSEGELGIVQYSISTDAGGGYSLINKFANDIIIPTQAIMEDGILYMTAITGRSGYLIALDFSPEQTEPSVKWVYDTSGTKLHGLCYSGTGELLVLGEYDNGGLILIRVDSSTGELVGSYLFPDLVREPFNINKIQRARILCSENGNFIVIQHDNIGFTLIYVDTLFDKFNAFDYSDEKNFSVQELAFNLDDEDTIYAVGGAEGKYFYSPDTMNPAVLVISAKDLREGLDGPVLQKALMMHSEFADDYYFYGVDIHEDPEDPWLGLVGVFEFDESTGLHAFFALANFTASQPYFTFIKEVPAYVTTSNENQYTLGMYRDLIEKDGYVWAFGITQYSEILTREDKYNVGVLFLSRNISDGLKWESTPDNESWPSVYVRGYTSLSTIYTENIHSDNSITESRLVFGEISLTDITEYSSILGKFTQTYNARDENGPEPIPEPWLVAVLVALLSLVVVKLKYHSWHY